MEPRSLLSPPRTVPPYSFPLLISSSSSTRSSCLLFPRKAAFFGTNLAEGLANPLNLSSCRGSFTITAAVKWRKEAPFDNVIEREKKLKLVLKIRNILVSQPDRIMSLKQLGRFRRDLGLTRKRRFIALLRRFPAVFEIVEEGVYSLRFRLTPEAERIYLEELRARQEMEQLHIVKLRKLLMMALDRRILLEKIAHLRHDLGLPAEFRDTICHRYPQYFRVVPTDRGPALELTHWDPELAISAAEAAEEENRIREADEQNLIIERAPKFKRVKLPRGLNLSKGEMRKLNQFKEIPYISPYSDFSELRPGTPKKEKHACAVVHEILSFTLEKKTLVDHLTHFREEFRFSQQLRGMLIRHPEMFYVSLKGTRDSVFLREAYRDSQLLEKDRMLILKEKLRALVAVPRFAKRGLRKLDETSQGDETLGGSQNETDEEWSDVDGLVPVGFDGDFDDEDDDDDDSGEDDWSDEEDESPPDFDDGEGLNFDREKLQVVNGSRKPEGQVLVPTFPDGRERERW
ncbi:protein WHAT'S THIS FACTOR 1, chloroplastic-like [Zingiber officinale]|uniref:PORR domain-containing protein n=1 Tax=Zingiber officinale TaxID=94328 RepID=A0A8J5HKN7_ZINOF|nr:protein WHAT'S THIS FACTOR 1, chloroplastic-like [Zingiber officinale]KAG6523419.1 hypothetical protein ZIOFF_013276 [Zingiber officinale]